MEVNLISHSQPSDSINFKVDNIQELIAFCASVSNPDNQASKETSDKLLKY